MKKILAVLLTVTMLLGAMVAVVSAGEIYLYQNFTYDDTFTLGDVNGDGQINSTDSYLVKIMMAGYEVKIDTQAADFTADGDVSSADAFCLKTCLAGASPMSNYDNGAQVYKMTIGGNEISNYSIVLPEGSTEEDNTYFAALNLMKYVRNVTGYEIPIVWHTKTTTYGIYFNLVSLESELGQELGIEGYKYNVTNGDLSIYGTYRGNGYAVYDILEDYLGIRFYHGNDTFVYKSRLVDIPEGVNETKIPELNFRHARQTFGQYRSDNSIEGIDMHNGMSAHYFANKLNASEGGYACYEKFYGTKIGPLYSNAHSFLEYWQMGTGTWPTGDIAENMSLNDRYKYKMAQGEAKDPYKWQPCATDDDEFDILFTGMIECNEWVMSYRVTFIEEGQTLFSFSIADNQAYCNCRECKKISTSGKATGYAEGYSGLYLHLYNRATVKAQDYYPGVRLYGIVYAKDFPVTIKPHKNFVILYCGTSCNNHTIGYEECLPAGTTLNGTNNSADVAALTFWGNLCKETGSELWFWIYPVTYHYYLVGCPNVLNFYWDMKWLHEVGNVTGFFYEGGGREYNFETVKEYAAVKYMWDMDMTYEEYCDVIKEYLYMYYGDGYEEIFRYIELQTEAGNECGTCFINNFDRPGDMYSYDYIAEHYDEMRELLEIALAGAKTNAQADRVETLLACCDFLGLSSVHTSWYLEGNRVEDYKERFDWMFECITRKNLVVFSQNLYSFPKAKNYDVNIMKQVYEQGSRRPFVDPFYEA